MFIIIILFAWNDLNERSAGFLLVPIQKFMKEPQTFIYLRLILIYYFGYYIIQNSQSIQFGDWSRF